MAKISARGATKVESIDSVVHYPATEGIRAMTIEYTHTLASDGRILRKVKGGSYKVVAKARPGKTVTVEGFRAYVRRFEAARS